MHFSCLIRLFIVILFSYFAYGRPYYEYVYNEEHEITISISTSSTTTKSSVVEESSEDYSDPIPSNSMETTTVKKPTKFYFDDDDDDVAYDDNEDDVEHEKVSSKTHETTTVSSSPSSFSKNRFSTSTLIQATTTISEIPVTHPNWPFSSVLYSGGEQMLFATTIDQIEVAAYLAKSNRDRLYLKIFVITVIICIFSLAVTFVTIHIVRNGRRYLGYHTPANASSNGQSKHLSDIKA